MFWLVRTVVCSGVHFRRVLSSIEGRLGQRMLLSDDRDDKRLLIPAGMFFMVIGWWLLSR